MALATNIVKYRKKNQLSQEQLGKALNISRQSISKWETGENLPSIDNLISLSGLLDISLDELITGEPYLHFPFNYGKPKSKGPVIFLIIMILLGIILGSFGNILIGLVVGLGIYVAIVWAYPIDYKKYYNYWNLEKNGIRYLAKSTNVDSAGQNLIIPIKALLHLRKTQFITYKQMKKIEIKVDLFGYQPTKSDYNANTLQMMTEPFYFEITTADGQIIYLNLKEFYWKNSRERKMLPTIISFLKRKNMEYVDRQGISDLVTDPEIRLVEKLYQLREQSRQV
ncbi:helix-turn-helix domain-containing protein [Companilactobacillus kimchiensis]|uniref:HTH cro/C1-type domain-containing protein n=1 Tax=Companilactobacillus kimchiensis TaxID=993692 RepID=A0A0R2LM34_9LACO|nr:helix-turn-helix transcriptional regulator [Companilactobacillus kimchiensis]KRO00029.1 hypothetical protein IV57_GL002044 [Companilactobacillus kimchiensis]